MDTMVSATRAKIDQLTDPDGAMVALALNIAARLDDPETWSAAGAKEYRQVMAGLVAASGSGGPSLDDLDDEEP